ncbi:MAG TPA: hypothetical protein VIK61_04665 [Acidimicrobiia bacterium]
MTLNDRRSTKKFDLDRITKSVPELETGPNRSNLAFINILFGLVVTQAVLALTNELVRRYDSGTWKAVAETRLSHLAVAIAVTTLSWIGYHQSQNYPPFLIKFFNIPLWYFVLDVTMVIAYYLVVATAEKHGIANSVPDARPEACLVAFVFVLYFASDWLGFRLFNDREYSLRLEKAREPDPKFGARRWVTVGFLVLTVVLAACTLIAKPTNASVVVAVDGVLIVLLLTYRLAKVAVYDNVLMRDPEGV